jgi:glyoxylase-like metal-dependent hydrolase (beta-lactamase superfamily II)
MRVEILPHYEPQSGTWSYLLIDGRQNAAALIDPVWVYDPVSSRTDANFVEGMLAQAAERGCRVAWVLETHAHADHLTAADFVRRRTGARIAIGRGICGVQQTFRRVFNLADLPTDGRQFDRLVGEGDVIPLGALQIRVLETPGHTSDSVSYRVGDAVFVGDTLFAPHYGTARCDFPGGDAGALYDSIQRLHALPDGTELHFCHDYPEPGHPPVCRVPVEASRQNNVHIGPATRREEFIAMRIRRDATLGLPRLILAAVQVNIRAGAAPAAEGNGVAYLRMPFNRPIADLVAAK